MSETEPLSVTTLYGTIIHRIHSLLSSPECDHGFTPRQWSISPPSGQTGLVRSGVRAMKATPTFGERVGPHKRHTSCHAANAVAGATEQQACCVAPQDWACQQACGARSPTSRRPAQTSHMSPQGKRTNPPNVKKPDWSSSVKAKWPQCWDKPATS